ncbi:MAG: HAD family hydrolase [Candidatus Bathyarchaeota archaeon]|nr:HAD family hydrolase [Candidatus Bathyarchaeota archaeon]
MKLKAIVFDLDSTLIQSHVDFVTMKKHMIKLLEEHGHPKNTLSPTDQTTVQIMEEAEKEWRRQNKPEQEQKQIWEKITVYMNQGEIEALEGLEEIPGANKTIHDLKEKGFRLAILTRSHHEYAIQALKKTGMLECFELILGRNETPLPKPYKEALEYTLQRMGLNRDEAIMIGDHQIDYDSAKNYGCGFIGVATGHRGLRSWENETPPTALLESVADLPEYLDENCE